ERGRFLQSQDSTHVPFSHRLRADGAIRRLPPVGFRHQDNLDDELGSYFRAGSFGEFVTLRPRAATGLKTELARQESLLYCCRIISNSSCRFSTLSLPTVLSNRSARS